MRRDLEIYYIANCGVLVCTPEATILLDGLFEETQYFDGPSPLVKKRMLAKDIPFEQIDYLLFTHNHKDHLDYAQLIAYLEANSPFGVFLPKDSSSGYMETLRVIQQKGIELISPDFWKEDIGKWDMKGIELTYFFSPHSGKEYQQVNHFGLLLKTCWESIYFSGDSDFLVNTQVERLNGSRVDVAFFNPYHLNSVAGRKIISEIHAGVTYIYHVPPERKDEFSIRRQAIKDLEKHQELLPPIRLILEPEFSLTDGQR